SAMRAISIHYGQLPLPLRERAGVRGSGRHVRLLRLTICKPPPHLQCACPLASGHRSAGGQHAARNPCSTPNPLPQGERELAKAWSEVARTSTVPSTNSPHSAISCVPQN